MVPECVAAAGLGTRVGLAFRRKLLNLTKRVSFFFFKSFLYFFFKVEVKVSVFGNPCAAHAATVFLPGAPNVPGDQRDGSSARPLVGSPPAGARAGGRGDPALALTHGRGGPGCPQPLQKEKELPSARGSGPRALGDGDRPPSAKPTAFLCGTTSETFPRDTFSLGLQTRSGVRKGVLQAPSDHTSHASYGYHVSV